MDSIRLKSGVLRIREGQQKQSVNRYEHNKNITKQIGKSINILPIKIHQNQISNNNRLGSEKKLIKTTVNLNLTIKPTIGSSDQLRRRRKTLLSIKSKNSIKIDDDQPYIINPLHQDDIITQSQHTNNINNKLIRNKLSSKKEVLTQNNIIIVSLDDDVERIFQQLRTKREITVHDHTHVIMQTVKFKCLLSEFQTKYRQLKTGYNLLEEKVGKYEYYFKQMRLKHVPDQSEYRNNNDIQPTNHQLRILNLQKKIQTLNYIIKQYRMGNNQQIKQFQQRLRQFRPNIQKQLTQKLAQSNQKYEKILKKVQYFENQCMDKVKNDWKGLVDGLQRMKKQNERYLRQIKQLQAKVQESVSMAQSHKSLTSQISHLQQQTLQQQSQIIHLTTHTHHLQHVIQQQNIQLSQLTHNYQQATYQLQGLQHLHTTLDNKQKTIKKNTMLINRLQCENIQLKSKIDVVMGEVQQKLFSEKHLQQSLRKANSDIGQLTNRLHEVLLTDSVEKGSSSVDGGREKEFFIGHMFGRVKSSYNQIISEYQNQLKLINIQSEKWKHTFEIITKNQQQKTKQLENIHEEIKTIHQKKLRCQGYFNNLAKQALDQQSKNQCLNCSHFIAYWGQLQNSYSQLKKLSTGIIQMQSMSLMEQRVVQPSQKQQQ